MCTPDKYCFNAIFVFVNVKLIVEATEIIYFSRKPEQDIFLSETMGIFCKWIVVMCMSPNISKPQKCWAMGKCYFYDGFSSTRPALHSSYNYMLLFEINFSLIPSTLFESKP